MILINKKLNLLGLRYVYKLSSFTKNINKNLLIIKFLKTFKRLIILRSPKHFNIGKLQLLRGNSSIIFFYPLNLKVFLFNNPFYFNTLINLFPLLPTTYLTHIEVKYNLIFKFSI